MTTCAPSGGRISRPFSDYIDGPSIFHLWLACQFTKLPQSTDPSIIFVPQTLLNPQYIVSILILAYKLRTLGGRCWRGLFSEFLSEWEDILWLPLGCIKKLAIEFSLKTSRKYTVWYSMLGLIHIEADDDHGIWTVTDILSLPEWLLVGGGFIADGTKKGYRQEFLELFTFYERDTRPQSPRSSADSSVSSTRLSTKSSTRAPHEKDSSSADSRSKSPDLAPHREDLMRILASPHPGSSTLSALRDYFRSKEVVLSRFDMELIARAVEGYCYTACSASSQRFQQDLVEFASDTGDTLDSFVRILENDKDKNKAVPNLLPKTFYIDLQHISRYSFDGGARISTEDIAGMINRITQVKVAVRGGKKGSIQNAVNAVVGRVSTQKNGKYMALAYDLANLLDVSLDIFDNRVYRILDIQKWNTFEEAQQADEDEKRRMQADINREASTGHISTPGETEFLNSDED